ncbi:MAG: T9SS type A sorting domain-containing protein [Bacteroidales bacterium]
MSRFIIIIVLFSFPLIGLAQHTFIHSYGFAGYNEGVEVLHHTNGYLIAGNSSYINGNTQIYLVKSGKDGFPLWEQGYFEQQISRINSAKLISADSILLSGTQHSGTAEGYNFFAAMVDTNGHIYWEQEFGGSGWQEFTDVKLRNNHLWLGGYTFQDTAGFYKPFIAQLQMNGTIRQQQLVNTSAESLINALDMIGDSVILTAGYSQNPNTNEKNGQIMLLDTGLNLIMDTTLTDSLENELLFVMWSDPNIITGGYQLTQNNSKQMWNIHINPFTPQQRSFLSGLSKDDVFYDVTLSPNNGYYYTGYTESYGAGKKDIVYHITNKQGFWKAAGRYGDTENETGYSIISDSSNRLIICGQTESWGPDYSNIILLKADSAYQPLVYNDHFSRAETISPEQVILKVFPNPFQAFLHVEIPHRLLKEHPTLIVKDISGRIVYQEKAEASMHINPGPLSPGLYFIGLKGSGIWEKIIRQH